MDYIRGLVILYTKDPEEEKAMKKLQEGVKLDVDVKVFKKSAGQGQLLITL